MLGTEGEEYVMTAEKFLQRYSVESAAESEDASLQAKGFKVYTYAFSNSKLERIFSNCFFNVS